MYIKHLITLKKKEPVTKTRYLCSKPHYGRCRILIGL